MTMEDDPSLEGSRESTHNDSSTDLSSDTDVSLEDALDGLMDAAQYAEDRIDEYDPDDETEIEESLNYRISELYQEVGRRAPESDWE